MGRAVARAAITARGSVLWLGLHGRIERGGWTGAHLMCGIVAYVGRKIAQPLLIEGLKRLEYRGYDSAGIAVIDGAGKLHIRRAVGRISVLEEQVNGQPLPDSHVGMAHTRWATHGAPNEANA